jgi:hypothetical protein
VLDAVLVIDDVPGWRRAEEGFHNDPVQQTGAPFPLVVQTDMAISITPPLNPPGAAPLDVSEAPMSETS